MIMLVLANWLLRASSSLLSRFIALLHFRLHGFLAIWAFGIVFTLLGILCFAIIERASLGFGRLQPHAGVDVRPGFLAS